MNIIGQNNAFLLLNKEDKLKLNYDNWVILSFPNSWKSFIIPINTALNIGYIKKLIFLSEGYEGNTIKTDSIEKFGDNKYIIIIPNEFYSNITKITFDLFSNSLNQLFIEYYEIEEKKRLLSLLDALGGFDENFFNQLTKYRNNL